MTGWTVHYYAHLEEYGDIKRHQWIEQGAVIGTVGDSGNAKGTPPHLHYGIYTPTGAVNPYPLIKQ
ncbi:M23 family metallopeptidase [Glaesserella parasuis]|nr:M23 family metallopeptidase [Glaesserella parasuis]